MSTQWKYLDVELKNTLMGSFKMEALQGELDKHGRLGWEPVNVDYATPLVFTPTLIFKKAS